MAEYPDLEAQSILVDRLTSHSCTQVSLGAGDGLIIDFGDLEESDAGDLSGALVLAIDCPWRVDGANSPVVGWDDEEEEVASQATILIGAEVEEVDLRRPGFDLNVQFSNGHRLRIFPDCRAYYSEDMSGGALPWQIVVRDMVSPAVAE